MKLFYSIGTGLVILQVMFSCSSHSTGITDLVNVKGNTIETRYTTGPTMKRLGNGNFAQYLRGLKLKPAGSKVYYYDGRVKDREAVYDAVVDMEIGHQNLQQCADAVMRLRAEFLFAQNMFDDIHFRFTSGFDAQYSKWRQGYRIQVQGNKVNWKKSAQPSNSYADFRKYLDMVFSYAGTLSLSKEMKSISLGQMQPGDVLIQGGSPGHAVMVVDMVQDTTTRKKYFMLAQSYMPAQDIQVLLNPNTDETTVWYELDPTATEIVTPEWRFTGNDLKRF